MRGRRGGDGNFDRQLYPPGPGRKDCAETGIPDKMGESISMSTATLTSSNAPSAQVAGAAQAAPPVPRPTKGVFKLIGEVLHDGGPGYLQFAITNICNAKCDFCGFAVDRFDPKQRRSVTLAGGAGRDRHLPCGTTSATCCSSAGNRWCTRTCGR